MTNSKNVIKAEASHVLEHVAESCYNTEYWTCSVCEIYWADEALTQITNSHNVIKANASHVLEHVAESCENTEYWFCSICEIYWADEALTQITNSKNVIKAEGHNIVVVEAVDATCCGTGVLAHSYCEDCGAHWLENGMMTNAMSVIVPALGATNVKHVKAVAATATKNGNVEHWICEDCGAYYMDADCTQLTNALSVVIGATGDAKDEAKEEDKLAQTGAVVLPIIIAATLGMGLVVTGSALRKEN